MKNRIFVLTFFYLYLLSTKAQSNTSEAPHEDLSFNLSHLDSILSDILWCGGSKEIVLILSDNGSVYRSTDKGFKWNKLTEVFQRAGYVELEKGENVKIPLFFQIFKKFHFKLKKQGGVCEKID